MVTFTPRTTAFLDGQITSGIPQTSCKYALGVHPHLRFNALGELDTAHD